MPSRFLLTIASSDDVTIAASLACRTSGLGLAGGVTLSPRAPFGDGVCAYGRRQGEPAGTPKTRDVIAITRNSADEELQDAHGGKESDAQHNATRPNMDSAFLILF